MLTHASASYMFELPSPRILEAHSQETLRSGKPSREERLQTAALNWSGGLPQETRFSDEQGWR